MGLRFRKSVRICKGVKVNFSKSGASLSLGGRGHSMNFGGRGTSATFGIPGTGLSYRTQITSHHKSRSSSHKSSSSGARRSSGVALPGSVQLKMNQDGKVEIQDNRGNPIYDQSVLRKIKATDSYKKMVQNLENQRQEKLTEAYNEAKAENDRFIEIYKLSPQVDKQEQYIEILNSLRPPVYQRKQYEVPYPTEDIIRERLASEAKENVHGNILTVGKLRKEYVESNLQNRLNSAISWWTQQKEAFDSEETQNEISETERYNAEYNSSRQYLQDLINGEDQVVSEAVESWISSCELPVEINVDYEWHQNEHVMYLDVDLPEIEDIPEDEVVRLASGNLKEKKKTQATLKQEYVNLVFGLAIFIASNIFNVSPAIYGIVISGYTQRRNKVGEINDEYIYSIKFTRDVFVNSVLKNVNPKDFCMRFENRSNITSGMLMKKIEPYGISGTTEQISGIAYKESEAQALPILEHNKAIGVPSISQANAKSYSINIDEQEMVLVDAFLSGLEKNGLSSNYKLRRSDDGSIEVIYKGQHIGAFNVQDGQSWIRYPLGNGGKDKKIEGSLEELTENTGKWIRYILNYL